MAECQTCEEYRTERFESVTAPAFGLTEQESEDFMNMFHDLHQTRPGDWRDWE